MRQSHTDGTLVPDRFEAESRLAQFHGALVRLARSDLSDLDFVLSTIVNEALSLLQLPRVGVWFLERDDAVLRCHMLGDAADGLSSSGYVLAGDDLPAYVQGLREARTVVIEDITYGSAMPGTLDAYFQEHGIISTLDVPVRVDGKLVGAICCELTGVSRTWSDEEKDFAGSLGDFVTLAFETHRRELAEERLKEANLALAASVRERTADLEQANRELEAFSYSISHDLRAPLRVIEGFAHLLTQDYGADLPAAANDAVDTIVHNSLAMSRLIDEILTFGRLGRKTLRVAEVNMREVVEAVFQAARRDGPWEVESEIQDMPAAYGDVRMITQIYTHLVAHAARHGHGTAPAARFVAGARQEDEEVVYFLRDNGPGLNTADSARLFDLFERLPSAGGVDGAGLGLAIVRRIVERHGGRVWVNGAPDQGSEFAFTLPRPAES